MRAECGGRRDKKIRIITVIVGDGKRALTARNLISGKSILKQMKYNFIYNGIVRLHKVI